MAGPFTKTEKYGAYRLFDVWELKGPRNSWKQHFQDYYKAKPVFEMLDG
jgi:lipase chaperone LimK